MRWTVYLPRICGRMHSISCAPNAAMPLLPLRRAAAIVDCGHAAHSADSMHSVVCRVFWAGLKSTICGMHSALLTCVERNRRVRNRFGTRRRRPEGFVGADARAEIRTVEGMGTASGLLTQSCISGDMFCIEGIRCPMAHSLCECARRQTLKIRKFFSSCPFDSKKLKKKKNHTSDFDLIGHVGTGHGGGIGPVQPRKYRRRWGGEGAEGRRRSNRSGTSGRVRDPV